jgi:hypothetical protein
MQRVSTDGIKLAKKLEYFACNFDIKMILAKQTGFFAPGCKFNVESTNVLLPLAAIKGRKNSSHPLCGW